MPGRYQFSLPERPQRDGWFRIGTLDVTTTALLVLLGVGSMVLYAIGGADGPFQRLVYYSTLVREGQVWRIITWPIANSPSNFLILLTFVFFWFIGHRVEDQLGRKRFTLLLLYMTVIPAALVALFRFTEDTGYAAGLGVLAMALLVVYAFDQPQAITFFNIPLWILAVAFLAINVLSLMGQRLYGMLLIQLGAAIVAAVTVRQWGMLDAATFIPRFGHSTGGSHRSKKSKKSKGGSGTVVDGPWGAPPSSPGLTQLEQLELDHLLDKTSASGLDSLSKAEKSRLNELSKKLRSR